MSLHFEVLHSESAHRLSNLVNGECGCQSLIACSRKSNKLLYCFRCEPLNDEPDGLNAVRSALRFQIFGKFRMSHNDKLLVF